MLWLSSGLVVFLPSLLFAQGSIILPWVPSSNTNVSGYNVYYGVSSGNYTNKISIGNFTNTTISGLAAGVTYYFAATAHDSSTNESAFSNEILYTVPTQGSTNTPPPPPPAPVGLQSTAVSQGLIILTWQPSSGTNVSGYNVYFGVSSGVYTNKISAGNVTNTTISGLLAGETYYFAATAYDSSADESAFSTEIVYTAPTGSTNTSPPPPAPFGLQSTAISQGSIILAWEPSLGTNVSGYNVYFGVSSGVYTNMISVGNSTNTTISGLVAGETYYFAATAYDSSADESAFSTEILYTVPQTNTPPPTPPSPSGLQSIVVAQGSIILTWVPSSGGNVSGYNVYYGVSSRGYTNKISVGNFTNTSISGLVAGETYYFAATAYNSSGGESDFSDELPYTVPSQNPTNPPPPAVTNAQSGSYNGLFSEQAAVQLQSAGSVKLTVTTKGSYSGSLQMGKSKYSFSGLFGSSLGATNHIIRKNTNALVVVLNMSTRGQVSGSVSDGTWMAPLYGELTGSTTTNSKPLPGKYTFVIPGKMSATASLGSGYGTMTVSADGAVRLAGTLGDGTKVSQGASTSVYGNWPLYVPLYSGGGLMMGWVNVANSGIPMGSFNWLRLPGPKPTTYQDGFAIVRQLTGSLYIAGTNPIPNPWAINLQLGGAVGAITNSGRVLMLKFSQSSGIFNGLAQNPQGKSLSFQGAYLQSINAGYGFILGTNESSPVVLTP